MEIKPGLWMIEGPGPAYLYQDADSFTLIDTGIKGDAERIMDLLAGAGGSPKQLRQIVLTHSHPDHIGSFAELAEETGAEVMAHELDIPIITGEAEFQIPEVPEAEFEIMMKLVRSVPPPRLGPVDRTLHDGDEIDMGGGAKVVHVPGHTPGSIAIYLPNEKILFTGDAAERDDKENLILGMFNLDQEEAIQSFQKLAQLDFETACVGHGHPEDKDACLEFRRVAATLAAG